MYISRKPSCINPCQLTLAHLPISIFYLSKALHIFRVLESFYYLKGAVQLNVLAGKGARLPWKRNTNPRGLDLQTVNYAFSLSLCLPPETFCAYSLSFALLGLLSTLPCCRLSTWRSITSIGRNRTISARLWYNWNYIINAGPNNAVRREQKIGEGSTVPRIAMPITQTSLEL